MKKKQPFDLSTDDLLKQLEELEESTDEPETKQVWTPDSVYNFVANYNIRHGNEKVMVQLLYGLYRSTCEEPNKFSTFCAKLRRYVVVTSIGGKYVALLNRPFTEFVEFKPTRTRIAPQAAISQFKAFRETLGIEPGTSAIASYMLYYLYKEYCRGKGKATVIPQLFFVTICKSFFKYKRAGSSRAIWFLVNKETTDKISDEDWVILQEARSKHYGKKKTKKRKVSWLRPKPKPKN